MGHSMGGAISFLYAACYPDDVEAIISLDMAGPHIDTPAVQVKRSGHIIDKYVNLVSYLLYYKILEAILAGDLPTFSQHADVFSVFSKDKLMMPGMICWANSCLVQFLIPEKH